MNTMVTGKGGTIWAIGFLLPSIILLIWPLVELTSPSRLVGGTFTIIAFLLPPVVCGWTIFVSSLSMPARFARFFGTLGLLVAQWCVLILLVFLWCILGPGNLLEGTQ